MTSTTERLYTMRTEEPKIKKMYIFSYCLQYEGT